jgi:hypothetical protein
MEGYCSTGQSPQWAAVPVEEEEEEELFSILIGQISTPLHSKLTTKSKNCLKYGLAQSM